MTQTNIRPELGLWRSTSLVVGNIIGSGIFMLPASLAVYGTLGLLGWITTSVGSICLALAFARLSRRFPKIGGPYAYSKEAFGEFVGFQMAWSYWVGTWASNAAISTAFVSYLSYFVPEVAANRHLAFAIAVGSVWLFTLINIASVRMTGIAQVFIVVLKVVPLCVIGIFGSFYVNFDNFFPLNPGNFSIFSAVAASSALTLYAFLGLESATIPAENVIDPEKTIPRATILGTVFSAVVYIWTTIVLLGIMPAADLAKSNAPFADAAGHLFGSWGSTTVAICAAISAFGTLNGWILLQGQMPMAAARDGLFPKIFGKLSKQGTPVFGLVLSSALMTLMLYMNYESSLVDQFTAIVIFTNFAFLLPYLYSTMADLFFLLQDVEKIPKVRFIRGILVTLLGFAYSMLIVAGAGQKAVYLGMMFMFLGFPVYAFMKRKNKV
jgi:APA family basic amino acid/polyamine antiporter